MVLARKASGCSLVSDRTARRMERIIQMGWKKIASTWKHMMRVRRASSASSAALRSLGLASKPKPNSSWSISGARFGLALPSPMGLTAGTGPLGLGAASAAGRTVTARVWRSLRVSVSRISLSEMSCTPPTSEDVATEWSMEVEVMRKRSILVVFGPNPSSRSSSRNGGVLPRDDAPSLPSLCSGFRPAPRLASPASRCKFSLSVVPGWARME
mmetsp:Transcript_20294/g.61638  ORF Transcript_20294/g.61638 Transcript_20294/m.61638 type:complete len:213 (+) Transcript_20294:69-707(+)